MKQALRFAFVFLAAALPIGCSVDARTPFVVSVSIDDGEVVADVDSFRSIDIAFSKAMNRYATERSVGISGYGGTLHFRWDGSGRSLTLLLGEPLERGRVYVLTIGGTCECDEGLDLGEDRVFTIYTYRVGDEFVLLSASPADGETVTSLDGLSIALTFSLPVEDTTIYDKVTVDPRLAYSYSFSSDRKTLVLDVQEHVRANETYTVSVSEELSAREGKRLSEECRFSFNTRLGGDRFTLEGATFVERGAGPPGVTLDVGYLGATSGVEKGMDLLLHLSGDFFLHSVEDCLALDPAVSHRLEQEGRTLRVVFLESMESGEHYTLTLQKSFESCAGVPLEREYRFSWTVDGPGSRDLSVRRIVIENPELPDLGTVIYEDGVRHHNLPMLLRTQGGYRYMDVTIFFSAALDVYRSLPEIDLPFMFGNTAASSGTIVQYDWDPLSLSLEVTFALPLIEEGGDSFYKLILAGGRGGLVDGYGNGMKETIEIYAVYDVDE